MAYVTEVMCLVHHYISALEADACFCLESPCYNTFIEFTELQNTDRKQEHRPHLTEKIMSNTLQFCQCLSLIQREKQHEDTVLLGFLTDNILKQVHFNAVV